MAWQLSFTRNILSQMQAGFQFLSYSQGGNTIREQYGTFAKGVAQYGFVVVIPNNMSSIMTRKGFNDVHLIDAVLNQMRKEENNPESPVNGIVDPSRLALSGHSFGGGVTALTATGGLCEVPFCDKGRGGSSARRSLRRP